MGGMSGVRNFVGVESLYTADCFVSDSWNEVRKNHHFISSIGIYCFQNVKGWFYPDRLGIVDNSSFPPTGVFSVVSVVGALRSLRAAVKEKARPEAIDSILVVVCASLAIAMVVSAIVFFFSKEKEEKSLSKASVDAFSVSVGVLAVVVSVNRLMRFLKNSLFQDRETLLEKSAESIKKHFCTQGLASLSEKQEDIQQPSSSLSGNEQGAEFLVHREPDLKRESLKRQQWRNKAEAREYVRILSSRFGWGMTDAFIEAVKTSERGEVDIASWSSIAEKREKLVGIAIVVVVILVLLIASICLVHAIFSAKKQETALGKTLFSWRGFDITVRVLLTSSSSFFFWLIGRVSIGLAARHPSLSIKKEDGTGLVLLKRPPPSN